MGTMINLALGRLEVDWGKNNFFTDHGCLYQESDLKDVPSYYAGDDWPHGEPIIEMNEGFGKPLGHIVDRLELMGYTLTAASRHYDHLHELHDLSEQSLTFETLKQAFSKVDVNKVSGNYGENFSPGKFVRKEIIHRLELDSELNFGNLKPDHWEIDLLLENFSPYAALRLLAENPANRLLEVNWDFTPLVNSGWATRDQFKPGALPEQRFLIVTEGSSDSKIIEHAIRLLRPHISDFFKFVDMTEGYPFTGTGNLYKFTQGLASIGILNKIIILYDNDAEGISKLTKTEKLQLPRNLKPMQLPTLDTFSKFNTYGPTGYSIQDINGKAAAIECYLDLKRTHLPEAVVRWSSYNNEARVYQGELDRKTDYMRDFLNLRHLDPNYDTSKIEVVLDSIVKACVAMVEGIK